jgi:hypothetical protein
MSPGFRVQVVRCQGMPVFVIGHAERSEVSDRRNPVVVILGDILRLRPQNDKFADSLTPENLIPKNLPPIGRSGFSGV